MNGGETMTETKTFNCTHEHWWDIMNILYRCVKCGKEVPAYGHAE